MHIELLLARRGLGVRTIREAMECCAGDVDLALEARSYVSKTAPWDKSLLDEERGEFGPKAPPTSPRPS